MSLTNKLRKAERATRAERTAGLSAALTASEEPSTRDCLKVYGPSPNRDKWRLIVVDASGRKARVYSSREEAEAVKARLLAEARAKLGKTIGESLDEYRDYRIKFRGVKAATAEDHCRHLRTLLPLDFPIVSLTADKARKIYVEYADRPNLRNGKPLSPNTHQWVLLVAKCWAKWCVKTGLLASSPFATVEPIGKRNAGKAQHTVDEARHFDRFLVGCAAAGARQAVGILLMLHLGLRQGEVSARVARDVDADGQILIIPFGKTESARRRVKVPQWLQPILRGLVKGLAPNDLLFSIEGRPPSRCYWWRWVREYCQRAGVPKVCPHSLRGLHATLAIEEGATSEAVARALGHTSFAMTAKHYASPDSVLNARVARAGQLLTPHAAQDDELSAMLSRLTPEKLAELRCRLVQAPDAHRIDH